MNRDPRNICRVYSVEADARGGRFTRKCHTSKPGNAGSIHGGWFGGSDGDPLWCELGPLLRGDPNVEVDGWEIDDVYAPRDSSEFHVFEVNTNSNASMDDVLAWAFAARWWTNYCWALYAKAIDVAPSFNGWPKNGPDDPRFSPGRLIVDGVPELEGLNPLYYKLLLGGGQFLKEMYVLDGSWSFYLNSLTTQIVSKALSGNVVDLILIQITLKHCALFFQACLKPAADKDLMTLLNPAARLS